MEKLALKKHEKCLKNYFKQFQYTHFLNEKFNLKNIPYKTKLFPNLTNEEIQ